VFGARLSRGSREAPASGLPSAAPAAAKAGRYTTSVVVTTGRLVAHRTPAPTEKAAHAQEDGP